MSCLHVNKGRALYPDQSIPLISPLDLVQCFLSLIHCSLPAVNCLWWILESVSCDCYSRHLKIVPPHLAMKYIKEDVSHLNKLLLIGLILIGNTEASQAWHLHSSRELWHTHKKTRNANYRCLHNCRLRPFGRGAELRVGAGGMGLTLSCMRKVEMLVLL